MGQIGYLLYENYKKMVEFVSISTDEHRIQMDEFLDRNPNYKWTFLFGGQDIQLKNDYKVTSLPSYILIDPNGNVLQAPAYKPTPNSNYITIDRTFHDLSWKEKRRKE